jgi:hypothetical protein
MNQYYSLTIGDLISRPKALGLVEHFGVVIGPDAVLQNTPERGEHLTSFVEFAAGQRIRKWSTSANPMSVVARARQILARPREYNAVNRNCQHTAHEAADGRAKSPIITILFWTIVAAVIWLLVVKRR